MAAPVNLGCRFQLSLALLSSWSFLINTLSTSSFSHLHEKVMNTTTKHLPLDDFDLSPSCDVAGIVAKFQLLEHRKSDEIGDMLVPLALEMIQYSKFHHDVISSWRNPSPVRTLQTLFSNRRRMCLYARVGNSRE